MFLLGARPGVAEGVRKWVLERFPLLDVCGVQHGYYGPQEEQGIIRQIRDSGANLVLVAFGAPKQDLWICDHLQEMGANVAIGVGGLFDFYSGRIPRAPLWMRKMGMEWVYRLVQEPGRLWKRYLIGNGLFLARVLRQKFLPRKRQERVNCRPQKGNK
jgi:N-acetylglucosaminyldiphosphoundecaprenol N-acetyl-beta-D-mannosaminyltransferase